MDKTNIALLFGGESSEHDVSVMSARNVYEAIDQSKFVVDLVYIDTDGRWLLCDEFTDHEHAGALVDVVPILGGGELRAGDRRLNPDVLLPILHGKNGEDGSVQGLAQLLHIPIVGCDMTSSALCMDKIAAKRIAAAVGIEVAPYVVYRRGDDLPNYEALRAQLGDVLFVKPTRAGSSVGVSKVHKAGELQAALELALSVDATVLIETALSVRELEVAVLGVPPKHEVSRVGEVLPGEEFYSYEDKYAAVSTSSTRIPAAIPTAIEQAIQRQARLLFAEIGASGLARVDFFLTHDGTVYFNEINTLPGFTDISMYPKLWQDAGLGYGELITRLVLLAIAR